MGRKKIDIQLISDSHVKRVTLKKRRLGLIKKAIQLSLLTDAKISLKIYYPQDYSFVEYHSHEDNDL